MRFSAAALILICFGCAEGPSTQEQALITEVEKRVQLPKGAGELRCYKRYYAMVRGKELKEMLGGSESLPFPELLVGTYRKPDAEEAPGIKWVGDREDVPKLYDGGCGDMTVWYATGWPGNDVKAICSLDVSGNMPEEIAGRPLAC